MVVTLYNFSKKVNSTAIPSGAGTDVNMAIRSGFSVHSPALEYRTGSAGLAYNYMYISDLGKYYYITESTYNAEENFFLIKGEIDVLATYRNQILASTQHVLRWQGSTDNTIYDDMACTISKPYVPTGQNLNLPFTITASFQQSCVVLNLAGTGRICMTGHNYNLMMWNLLAKSDPLDVGTYFTRDVARLLNNPMSYIESALCIPIQAYGGATGTPVMATSGSEGLSPRFGWYTIPECVAHRCGENIAHFEDVIGVANHPQATSVDDYLNYPPFTDVKLYVAGIGIIQIDGNKISGAENLRIQGTIDYATGVITIRVKKESNRQVIAYATGQLGYSLNVAQAHSADIVSMGGNAIMGSVIGGMSGGVGGALLGGIGGTMNSLGNNAGVTVHGSTGGAGAWYDYNGQFATVMQTFKQVRKPPASLCGLPYNRSAKLSTLGGFVICSTGAVVCKGTEAEKMKISSYLKGGLYIE